MLLWLGGWGPEMGATAEGIGAMTAGAADERSAGGPLGFLGTAAAAASPSWLAAHPVHDVVYATLESEGLVQAYARRGERTLTPLGSAVAAGESVCHAVVAPDGSSLIASCGGDGRVVRIPLDAAGRPGRPVAAAAATDPRGAVTDAGGTSAAAFPDIDLAAATRALRAAAGEEFAHLVPAHDGPEGAAPEGTVAPGSGDERISRAHSAAFLPDGRIATTDLGLDLVRIWRAGASGLRLDHEVVLPLGSGPRHMVVHPSGHLYVVTEISCEVFVLGRDRAGVWHLVGGLPAPPGHLPGDTAAELAVSRDGDLLYAGLRGSNTISVARVRGQGEQLTPVALVEAGVDGPRHHLVVRDTLLVAGQRSNDIVSMSLDLRTGIPGRVRFRTNAPSPTRLLPARRR